MGATISWEPTARRQHVLNVGGRSSFIAALTRAFGEPTWCLSSNDVPVLRGIRAALGEDEAIDALLTAIETHGVINVQVSF